MTKVLLVSPPFESGVLPLDEYAHYPLGLAYIHSNLEKHGHEVWTLGNRNGREKDCIAEVWDYIMSRGIQVVGINMLTHNRVACHALIRTLKGWGGLVVVGGIHATILYREILREFPWASVCVGEGEETMMEVADCVAQGKPLNGVPGLAVNVNGSILYQSRELNQDLDALPLPKHAVFMTPGRHTASMLTSRGCPFSCSYCCLSSISEHKVRYRSVRNVLGEIFYIYSKFPQITRIWFHDDVFMHDPERVRELCRGIIKIGIRMGFVCSARFRPIDVDTLRLMEQAGFTMVMFGMESGSQTVLSRAHKSMPEEAMLDAMRAMAHTRMKANVFLMVGLPGETKRTIDETASMVRKMQRIKYLFVHDVALTMVYPGTELCKQAGYLPSWWMSDFPTPYFNSATYATETLRLLRLRLQERVSFSRILTWRGFWHQWYMIPYALWCMAIQASERESRMMMILVLETSLPRVFGVLRWVKRAILGGKTNA